jgi:hypothetical protein
LVFLSDMNGPDAAKAGEAASERSAVVASFFI